MVGFFSFFVFIIHELLGTPNNNVSHSVSNGYRPLLFNTSISSLHEVPLPFNILQQTTLNPVLAECLLDAVHQGNTNNFWKHPILGYFLKTLICSTQPSSLRSVKSHRPITNRLFAENKIVIPNEIGNSKSEFVNFHYHSRRPILITLLECSCYIIKIYNYNGRSSKGTEPTIPALHVSKVHLSIPESSTSRAKETVVEDRLDEITPEASTSRVIVDKGKMIQEGAHARTLTNDMVILHKLHPDIETSFPLIEGGNLSALNISAAEICVDGERVYFSRGAAGDSSFFVYQYKNSSFYVIAHLVFNRT